MDLGALVIVLLLVAAVATGFLLGRHQRRAESPSLTDSEAVGIVETGLDPAIRPSVPAEQPLPPQFLLAADGQSFQGGEYLVRVLDKVPQSLRKGHVRSYGAPDTLISAAAMAPGRLVAAVPALSQALAGGRLVEIVGPPHVVAGLADKTMGFMQKDGNSLGTAVWTSNHQIAGQVQFQGVTSFAAPVIVFELLAIATCQYYLVEINKRLDTILEGVEEILERMRSEAWGKLKGAQTTLRELAEQLAVAQEGSPELWARLAAAEQNINAIVGESRRNLGLFFEQVRQVANDEPNREEMGRILGSVEDFAADASMYYEAAHARMQWFQVALARDFQSNPHLAEVRRKQMVASMDDFNAVQVEMATMGPTLYSFAEVVETPSGFLEGAWDSLIRFWEWDGQGEEMPSRAKDAERALSEFKEFTDALLETSEIRLSLQEPDEAVIYQLWQGEDGEIEWGVRKEEVHATELLSKV